MDHDPPPLLISDGQSDTSRQYINYQLCALIIIYS